MSELRPDVRAFLESTRSAHLAERGDRTRSRLALEARMLLPPLAELATPPGAEAPIPAPAAPPAPPASPASPGPTASPAPVPAPAPLPPALPAPLPPPIVSPPAAAAASSGAVLAAKKVLIGAALFASGGASTVVYELAFQPPPPAVASIASARPSPGRGASFAPRRPGAPAAFEGESVVEMADEDGAPAPSAELALAEVPEGLPALAGMGANGALAGANAALVGAGANAAPAGMGANAASSVSSGAGVGAGKAPGPRGGVAAGGAGKGAAPVSMAPVAAPVSTVPVAASSAAVVAAAPSASAPTLASSTVAAELRLVREAQAQLRAGQAERALASLAEHARLYPQGILREERAAARVLALCSLGRGEQARGEAEAFARVAPHSPYVGGLRRPCPR